MSKTAALLISTCLISACAQHASEIPSQYMSPGQYSDYNCKQIQMEIQNVSARVTTLGAEADRVASNDQVAMGVGIVLFWPALFFLDKNSAQSAEYGRLRGQFDALESSAIQKKCGFHIEHPKAPEPQKTPDAPAYPSQGESI